MALLIIITLPTHWFFVTDYSMKSDDVWMLKLNHDGCLLKEFHLVLVSGICLKGLQSNLLALPHTLLNITKLTRFKVAHDSKMTV